MNIQVEWGKLLVLLCGIVGGVVLLVTGAVTESAGVGIIMAVLGYVTGNGRLASKGEQSVPAIGARPVARVESSAVTSPVSVVVAPEAEHK